MAWIPLEAAEVKQLRPTTLDTSIFGGIFSAANYSVTLPRSSSKPSGGL